MENDMKHLMKYVAEMGCIKINGVLFENWVGDGIFSLYFRRVYQKDLEELDGYCLI